MIPFLRTHLAEYHLGIFIPKIFDYDFHHIISKPKFDIVFARALHRIISDGTRVTKFLMGIFKKFKTDRRWDRNTYMHGANNYVTRRDLGEQ